MKVIDLEIYRARKAIRELEQRIGQLSLSARTGQVNEMKTCFKEWLRVSNIK